MESFGGNETPDIEQILTKAYKEKDLETSLDILKKDESANPVLDVFREQLVRDLLGVGKSAEAEGIAESISQEGTREKMIEYIHNSTN